MLMRAVQSSVTHNVVNQLLVLHCTHTHTHARTHARTHTRITATRHLSNLIRTIKKNSRKVSERKSFELQCASRAATSLHQLGPPIRDTRNILKLETRQSLSAAHPLILPLNECSLLLIGQLSGSVQQLHFSSHANPTQRCGL